MEQVPAPVPRGPGVGGRAVTTCCFGCRGWGSLEAAALPMTSSGIVLVFNPPVPGAGL